MTVTPADIKARFPEFDTVSDGRIAIFIADATIEVDADEWGVYADKGITYLTAHFLTLATGSAGGGAGSVGPVQSQSVGDVSVTFASVAGGNADGGAYGSTVYGQEYQRLLIGMGAGALVV